MRNFIKENSAEILLVIAISLMVMALVITAFAVEHQHIIALEDKQKYIAEIERKLEDSERKLEDSERKTEECRRLLEQHNTLLGIILGRIDK